VAFSELELAIVPFLCRVVTDEVYHGLGILWLSKSPWC